MFIIRVVIMTLINWVLESILLPWHNAIGVNHLTPRNTHPLTLTIYTGEIMLHFKQCFENFPWDRFGVKRVLLM